MEDLLAGNQTDAALRYAALRIRYEERRTCGGDVAGDRRVLVDLGPVVPDALATSIRLRLEAGRPVTRRSPGTSWPGTRTSLASSPRRATSETTA